MAELLITVRDSANYEDGDVLVACSNHRLHCHHAGIICHCWSTPVTSAGWREPNSMCRLAWCENVYQYRYERLGQNLVRRTNLRTSDTSEFGGPIADPEGEFLNVVEYLARRQLHKRPDGGCKSMIFGDSGSEVWYGGRQFLAAQDMTNVWDVIERMSAYRKATDAVDMTWGFRDKRSFLIVPVDDMTEAERHELEGSLWDRPLEEGDPPEGATMLKKREHNIDWRARLGLSARTRADAVDYDVPVEKPAGTTHTRAAVVTRKVA